MRIYLSRSIYDDPKKILRIIKSLRKEGHEVIDGVEVNRWDEARTNNPMEVCENSIANCDLVLFVPVLTPGVREELKFVKEVKKPFKILKRIVR